MKSAVFGISLSTLLLLGVAPQLCAAEAEDTGASNPTTVTTGPTTAPASVDVLKQRIDAMNAQATRGLDDVVRLVQAGVDKNVIETYVRNSTLPPPNPNDLIFLHEKGVPQEVVNALIEHGREQQKAAQTAAAAAAANNQAEAAPGGTYNNYVYTIPNSTTPATYNDNAGYGAQNNNLLIIPYNPYRNYYQSYYSSPFYSSWGYWNWWDSSYYCPPPYRSYFSGPGSFGWGYGLYGLRGPINIGRGPGGLGHGPIGGGPGFQGFHGGGGPTFIGRHGSGGGPSFGGRPPGGPSSFGGGGLRAGGGPPGGFRR